ncbi:tRNA pseudouridine32 synthase/23S rRNA pseudouridine746 synthase [Hydrogenophaga palleronii]|uniref:tRNA pseudouridine32 synthase/23S rRNA pseudouridine746 synthase n=1 Tax=Hydrogenophaga palleronii TaxID=65655 RepID=A0ABU1WGR0_9BURK|nr:pseudouridine synthase [Hydrogenophaga palleronii]MDR7148459.1 tRNA pseudouridine32 synthase/23S rRNA pseudouridine746 synthase [Hydrogenophaga palleronii]
MALPPDKTASWSTVLDYLADRLSAVGRDSWHQRMDRGEVLDESAQALLPDAPFLPGARVYYYRHLADEPDVPFQEAVVFQDDHLLVADKPHFLPVTPTGRYVQQSLLVRLKNRLGIDTLSPIHRIDRETAGLVVFSLRPQDRAAYQGLFRDRAVAKTYEAIAPFDERLDWPLERRSRIVEEADAFFRMTEATGEPNSETHIDLLERRGEWARYALKPVTGKRHQLRVHMNALGLPIAGDQFYPRVLRGPDEAEDFAHPLRLQAKAIRFTDPLTGALRHFESQQALSWPD